MTGAGLFLLVFLVFLPVVNNQFVHYDDEDYVYGNPHVKAGLSIAGIVWAFTTGHAANWHPLTWISHMADWQIYGDRAWGHHLTSILLHSLNVTLLFLVLRKLTGANWKSLAAAMLFGLHPLRVESVAWVAERKDVLSTLFWMLTIWAYAFYVGGAGNRKPKSIGFYFLSLIFFICGLMSKPMVVTLPFVLLLLDWWPLRRISSSKPDPSAPGRGLTPWQALMEKLPFFALATGASVVTYLVQQRGEVMSENVSLLLRVENALVSYCRYIGKLFWPTDLAVIYPHPLRWPAGLVITCTVLLLLLSFTAFLLRKRRPWLAMGWCWFLGTLVPVIGIVQVGSQSMADRYSYIPSIGIIIIAIWLVQELVERRPGVKSLVPFAVGACIVACIVVTERQIPYWRNSLVLFQHTVDVTSDNVVALNNLGKAMADTGNSKGAMEQYQEALKIRPGDFAALNNLGAQLTLDKRLPEAIGVLQRAVEIDRNAPQAHNNLGQALSDSGSFDAAIDQFKEALRLRPDYAKAQHNWGLALAGKRMVDESIPHFREAIQLDPFYFDAYNNLGIAYYAKGRFDDAIAQFQQALRLHPGDERFKQNIEIMLKAKEDARKSTNPGGAVH